LTHNRLFAVQHQEEGGGAGAGASGRAEPTDAEEEDS